MSSVVRAPAQVKDVRVWSPIMSPTYHDDTVDHTVLIPFTCENGVLDINIQDGSQTMIDNGDLYNETGFSWRMVRQMGGERLVTSLGPNFVTWLNNYLGEVDDIQLVIPPTMTKVQQHVTDGAGSYGGSMLNSNYVIRYTDIVSGVPAPTDNYIYSGNNGNNFYTAWVFKTPLTISYNDGDPYYMTFQTMFQRPN